MRQHSEPIGFGVYLRDAILAAGFVTPSQFAREVGTDPSVVLRWINGDQRPTISSIERIAPVLGRSITDVVTAAYPDRLGHAAPAVPTQIHPLAYELGRILAEDSPIPGPERAALAQVLERVVEPYRRDMRRRRPA